MPGSGPHIFFKSPSEGSPPPGPISLTLILVCSADMLWLIMFSIPSYYEIRKDCPCDFKDRHRIQFVNALASALESHPCWRGHSYRMRLMRKSTIYVLIDPREITPVRRYRYVGKTVKKLADRRRDHITDSTRKKDGKWQYNNRKDRWVRKLVREGVEPDILKIEIVDEDQDVEREIYWIAHLRVEGFNLTNCTDGGEGKKGYHPSEATKEKIRQSLLGTKASADTRAKMSMDRQGSKNSNYGNKHSEAAKKKMREGQRRYRERQKALDIAP